MYEGVVAQPDTENTCFDAGLALEPVSDGESYDAGIYVTPGVDAGLALYPGILLSPPTDGGDDAGCSSEGDAGEPSDAACPTDSAGPGAPHGERR